MRLLVTGSDGLIGNALAELLDRQHHAVVRFDVNASPEQDIRNVKAIARALEDVEGVVHLAAISRVDVAQRDPELCHSVNVLAFQSILQTMSHMSRPPWMVFVSSREVYGNQTVIPVREAAVPSPANVYAFSKLAGERLLISARSFLPAANIVRLSNVYGSINDYRNRVVPAFARVAAHGGTLVVRGKYTCLDFVHVEDAVRGIEGLVNRTAKMENLDTIHLASGTGTTLHQLSEIAVANSRYRIKRVFERSPAFTVSHFIGDSTLAARLLNWRTTIEIGDGFRQLVSEYANV